MSWEDTATYRYRCPCGAGTFTVRHRSDDWGRHDEVWEMQCPACISSYVLHEDNRLRNGTSVAPYGWVPRRLWERYEATQKAKWEAERELHDLFRRRYWERLMEHFDGMSKKDIWEGLTGGGTGYPVLSTFYKHVHDDGLENVIDGFVNSRGIGRISALLSVSDTDISTLLDDISSLARDEEAKLSEIRHIAVRTGNPLPD